MPPESREIKERLPKDVLILAICTNCDTVYDTLVYPNAAIVGWVLSCTNCGQKTAVIKEVYS